MKAPSSHKKADELVWKLGVYGESLTRETVEEMVTEIMGNDAEIKAISFDGGNAAFVRCIAWDFNTEDYKAFWVYTFIPIDKCDLELIVNG